MIKDRNIANDANIQLHKLASGFGGVSTMLRHDSYAYYVDGRYGSDNNSGRSKDEPFATVAKAISTTNARINWSNSPWANSDVIYIAPGVYAENLTSLPHGATMIGLGDAHDGDGENGVKIKPASGAPVDVGTFVNAKIFNVAFESPDTSRVFDAAILNNVQLVHCVFKGAPEATTSTAGIYTNDSVNLTVEDCRIMYVDCGIDFVYADADDSVTRALIKNNYMTYMSEAGIRVSANLVSPASLIVGNYICQGSTTLAIGIDLNHTNTIGIYNNFITASDGIEGDTTGTYVGGNYCLGQLE